MRPSVWSPTGTEIGPCVSTISTPAGEPVGRVHGDGPDAIVAEVLLHLRDQLSRAAVLGDLDAERVVDLGSRSGKTASSTTPLISTIFPVFLPLLLSATESPLMLEVGAARGLPQAPHSSQARFVLLGGTDRVCEACRHGRDRRIRGSVQRPTAWTRNLQTPLRSFLQTETGSAAFLLAAVVAALVWANVDPASYERVWTTTLSITVGGSGISQDLRGWINTGLMAFFFFVIGLEARREFDLGELRERRRVLLPLLAGVGGMVVPVAIYLALNAGHSSAHGWGTAMSTDTAFALGLIALVGTGLPDRLRAFLLTVAVVDDVVALS
jgi:hypothetical protein